MFYFCVQGNFKLKYKTLHIRKFNWIWWYICYVSLSDTKELNNRNFLNKCIMFLCRELQAFCLLTKMCYFLGQHCTYILLANESNFILYLIIALLIVCHIILLLRHRIASTPKWMGKMKFHILQAYKFGINMYFQYNLQRNT